MKLIGRLLSFFVVVGAFLVMPPANQVIAGKTVRVHGKE